MSNYRFKQDFSVGQRVAYRAAFLRSIMDYSYDSASLRGTIKGLEILYTSHDMPRVVLVKWDGITKSSRVLECNLIAADRIHLEPA